MQNPRQIADKEQGDLARPSAGPQPKAKAADVTAFRQQIPKGKAKSGLAGNHPGQARRKRGRLSGSIALDKPARKRQPPPR